MAGNHGAAKQMGIHTRQPMNPIQPGDLAVRMSKLTDEELLEMFPIEDNCTTEEIEAASAELQNRNIRVPQVTPLPAYRLPDNESGRNHRRADKWDVAVSILVPGWGIVFGLQYLLKGEWLRAFVMISLGVIPILLLFVLWAWVTFRDFNKGWFGDYSQAWPLA